MANNIKSAVGVCDEIIAIPDVSSTAKDRATLIQLDLLAQGVGFHIEGFEAKLRDACEKLKVQMPPSPFAARANVYLLRLDYFDKDGHPKDGALDAILKFADESPKNASPAVQLLGLVGDGADDMGNTELALKAYRTAKEKFPDAGALKSIQANLKRLESIGKDFPLEGTLVGGEKVDPAKYKGKVVLVDFGLPGADRVSRNSPMCKRSMTSITTKDLKSSGFRWMKKERNSRPLSKRRSFPGLKRFPRPTKGRGGNIHSWTGTVLWAFPPCSLSTGRVSSCRLRSAERN